MEWIEVSTHAARRWHERTDSPGVGPIVAWNEAAPAPDSPFVADEVRYHHDTDLYLLRNNDVLVTVTQLDEPEREIAEAAN